MNSCMQYTVGAGAPATKTVMATPAGAFAATTSSVGIDVSTAEGQRLQEDKDGKKDWRRWGPYLSERQWSTVREDYSPNGSWY